VEALGEGDDGISAGTVGTARPARFGHGNAIARARRCIVSNHVRQSPWAQRSGIGAMEPKTFAPGALGY
jgi:hypothetical protein